MHVKSSYVPDLTEAEIAAAFRIDDEARIGLDTRICAATMNAAAGEK